MDVLHKGYSVVHRASNDPYGKQRKNQIKSNYEYKL